MFYLLPFHVHGTNGKLIKTSERLLIYWKNSFEPMIWSSISWSSTQGSLSIFFLWNRGSEFGNIFKSTKSLIQIHYRIFIDKTIPHSWDVLQVIEKLNCQILCLSVWPSPCGDLLDWEWCEMRRFHVRRRTVHLRRSYRSDQTNANQLQHSHIKG